MLIQQPVSLLPFPDSEVSESEHRETEDLHLREELTMLKDRLAEIQKELYDLNAIQCPLVGIEQVAQYFGK